MTASNRDERIDRSWLSPGRHWPDRPEIVAGKDELAGGTWLGLNDFGMMAAILNRGGSLGPEESKRSRGELTLEALDFADAAEAATALSEIDGRAYRPFNMIVADNRDAFWLCSLGKGKVQVAKIAPGLSMVTAHDLNDMNAPRIRHFLPLWREAKVPDPSQGDWKAWKELLLSNSPAPNQGREGAMFIASESGFGTVSSSLLALPSPEQEGQKPIWLFAPASASWSTIDI